MKPHLVIAMTCVISIMTIVGCEQSRGAEVTPQPTATPPSMDQLIAILMNPDSQGDDLVFAAHNLTRWGPAAAPAVPGLRRALRYPHSYDARVMAAEALAAIGPAAKEAIPELSTWTEIV